MSELAFAKICMVLTFGFAGLNLHQMMASYRHIVLHINEFREVVRETESTLPITFLDVFLYLVLPVLYLFLLFQAGLPQQGIWGVGGKFVFSAGFGLWLQNRILRDHPYSPWLHYLGKGDNFLNLLMAAGVAYFLIFR